MDNMERRQNEELLEARRLRRQEQKRRLLMRQRVLVIVLLVIVILSLILILRGCRNRREHPELYVKKDNALELQTEPDATVNIAAVGDIMITDDLLADARQPDGSYQFAESFAATQGFTRIVLNARQTAEAFYHKQGYTSVGEPFVELGIGHVRMEKALGMEN